jgi:hypothetical protein
VNLIASYASAYINNPYVWFASQNEPSLYGPAPYNGAYNLVPVTTEQLAYYNAVRATGNNSIVIISASGNDLSEVFPSNVAAKYSVMNNAILDLHFYNVTSGYSTSESVNLSFIAQDASLHQAVTDVNGVIPVIIGEYGNSTDGSTIDPGWQATVTAVNTTPDGEGSLAWNWHPGGTADQLQNSPYNGTSLTAYGMLVAQYILSGPSPPIPPGSSGPIPGATASTYVPVSGDVGNTLTVSVVAHNTSGASIPATSLATSAVIP